MKTLIIAINVLWLIAGSPTLRGAAGDSHFVDHDDLIPGQNDGSRNLSPDDLEKVRTHREYLPAELDPQGNWGKPSNGVQMGLRFSAESFSAGDGIDAAVIVRNIGSVPLTYAIGAPVELFLIPSITIDGNGQTVPRLAEARATNDFQRRMARMLHNPKSFHLAPGTQRKHQMRLSDVYDLTKADKYALNFSLKFGSQVGDSFTASTATIILNVTNNSPANPSVRQNTFNQGKPRSASVSDLPSSPANAVSTLDSVPSDAAERKGSETQKSPPDLDGTHTSSVITGGTLFAMTVLLTLGLLAWGFVGSFAKRKDPTRKTD